MEESESKDYFARIVKTSAFMFGLVMISKVLGYAYKIVIARYFDAEVYGLFSLSMTIVGIATSLAGFGLFEGLIRQISIYRGQKDNQAINTLVKTSKNFLIIIGFIVFGILFLLAPLISGGIFHEPRLTLFIQIMALTIPLLLVANLFISVLRAHERVKTQSVLTNIVQNSAKFFGLLMIIYIGLGISSVPLSYVVSSSILAIVAWVYAKRILSPLKDQNRKDGRKMLIEVISYSWPLMFVGVLSSIFYWTDSFAIGYFLDVREVGIYNAAITLVAFLGIIPELFIQLLFPVAALNLSKNNNAFVNSLIKRVAKWILCINSMIALACFFFADHLLLLLFGQDFLPAATSLRILAVGALFATLSAYFTNLLTIAARTKTILTNIIVVAILNLGLDIILVPNLGIKGAAIGTAISGLILFLITIAQVKKIYSVYPLNRTSYLSLLTVFALFAIGFLWIKPDSILITILIVFLLFIVYLLYLLYIRFFDDEDISLFRKVIKKIVYYATWKRSSKLY